MMTLLSARHFHIHIGLFILLNLSLYLFMNYAHPLVPFNHYSYFHEAHHYTADPRASSRPFNLLSALGQYDAQWYLKIASVGYFPASVTSQANPAYAFFPLYPLCIRLLNLTIHHIELSAFILTVLLLLSNFISLYLVIGRLFSPQVAVRTSWLLFLSPFSIFYRSYYSEGLELLLLIWFSYFFVRRNYLFASVFLGGLCVTKGITLPLLPLFFIILLGIFIYKSQRIDLKRLILYILASSTPLLAWTIYNYTSTGDPLYYYHVVRSWFPHPIVPSLPLHNILVILNVFVLPFHDHHFSQLDVIVAISTMLFLYCSRRALPFKLWLISLVIGVTPLLTKDLDSYSRYQSVSFPLFVYLSLNPGRIPFLIILIISAILLFVTSLYFINWHWIG